MTQDAKRSTWVVKNWKRLVVPTLGIVLFLLLMVSCTKIFFANRSMQTKRSSETVQLYYSESQDKCYAVVVVCSLTSQPRFAAEKHSLSEIRLLVVEHQLGYQNYRLLFDYNDSRSLSVVTTAIAPTWGAKYIPHDEFILPTGRLFLSNECLCFVFFDGEQCKLLEWNEGEEKFIETRSEAHKKALRSLWSSSFSPNDVYWCYALVKHPNYFALPGEPVAFAEFMDTKNLYDGWEHLRANRAGLPE